MTDIRRLCFPDNRMRKKVFDSFDRLYRFNKSISMDICIGSFMLSLSFVVIFYTRDTGKCLMLDIDYENIEDIFPSNQKPIDQRTNISPGESYFVTFH